MITKVKTTRLNIPSDADQFAEVAFVNEMTPNQLKVLIKRFWNNLQSLANLMDSRRKDVAKVLDEMLDGVKWNEKEIDDRFIYTFYKGLIHRFDTLNKQTTVLNENFEVIEKSIQGLTLSEIKERNKR
jgi:flagellar biosynthesis chaperone FliJ